ncbi:DUF2065 domain-containing protein [Thermodesulfobacteriota bacterium]
MASFGPERRSRFFAILNVARYACYRRDCCAVGYKKAAALFRNNIYNFWMDTKQLSVKEGNLMKFFLCVLGMVMVIEGLPYFAFPDKMKYWLEKILEIPDSALRKFGFVIMLAGLGLVYMGKS